MTQLEQISSKRWKQYNHCCWYYSNTNVIAEHLMTNELAMLNGNVETMKRRQVTSCVNDARSSSVNRLIASSVMQPPTTPHAHHYQRYCVEKINILRWHKSCIGGRPSWPPLSLSAQTIFVEILCSDTKALMVSCTDWLYHSRELFRRG